MALQNIRSNTSHKRPTASGLSDGQIAINTNADSPGLFFKDAGGALIKVGPVHIGTSAPNSVPAGSSGNAIGEQWLDTSNSGYVFKIWDGTAWRSEDGQFVDVAGDTMTGDLTISGADLIMSNGEIVAETGSAATPSITFTGDLDTGFYKPAANELAISTSGTGRLFIDDSGNVGIGTSSPDTRLHIASITPIFTIEDTSGATAAVSRTCILRDDDSFQHQVRNSSGVFTATSYRVDYNATGINAHRWFYANTQEAMRIDSSGNVGIGTSDARCRLSASIADTTAYSTSLPTSGGNPDGTEIAYFQNTDNTSTNNKYALQSFQIGAGAGQSNIFGRFGLIRTAASAQAFVWQLRNLGGAGATATQEAMRIDSSGNVGIGTDDPDELLHIEGDTAEFKGTNTNPIADTAGTEQVFKFGIEGQKNNLYGPAGSIIFRQDDTTWSSVSANQKPTRIEFCTQDGTTSDTSESPRMVIDQDGNVGIGTSTPGAKLDVSGDLIVGNTAGGTEGGQITLRGTAASSAIGFLDINANDVIRLFSTVSDTDFQIGTFATGGNISFFTANSERLRIDSTGNVGIGTSSPEAVLDVRDGVFSNNQDFGIQVGLPTGQWKGKFGIKSNASGVPRLAIGYPTDNSGNITEAISIPNNGNVGIGTSSPSALLDVNGSLSKNSGSFKIDHPLPALTETHHLVHSFVEAPDASNLYAGMVQLSNGVAVVNIDTAHRMTEGTFEALNDPQSWSSSNESGYAPVKSSLSRNLLTIECQDQTSSDTVYYEVRGIRKDQHMIETEWTDESGRVITEPLKQVLADAGL